MTGNLLGRGRVRGLLDNPPARTVARNDCAIVRLGVDENYLIRCGFRLNGRVIGMFFRHDALMNMLDIIDEIVLGTALSIAADENEVICLAYLMIHVLLRGPVVKPPSVARFDDDFNGTDWIMDSDGVIPVFIELGITFNANKAITLGIGKHGQTRNPDQ